MPDRIFDAFVKHCHETAMALAAASDRLVLIPEPAERPQRWIAEFHCRGLVCAQTNEIVEADFFRVGITFPDDYLKTKPNCARILTFLEPREGCFHPNIKQPFLCAGNLRMGTDLVTLLFQLYEIITYQKFQTADALDPVAAEYARANMSRFPIDPRPLRRRAVSIEEIQEGQP